MSTADSHLTGSSLGIGTTNPRSVAEIQAPAAGTMGPVLTITNSLGNPAISSQSGSAVAIDLNTYPPDPSSTITEQVPVGGQVPELPGKAGASGSTTGTNQPTQTKTINTIYNPAARILAVDSSSGRSLFATDIVFLVNKPPNQDNGLVEIMRLTVNGVGISEPSPLAPLHIVGGQPGNPNAPILLVQANSNAGPTPRVGMLDTATGAVENAPIWFIDNSADNFRIFRQPDSATAGTVFLNINNTGVAIVLGNSSTGPTPRLGLLDQSLGSDAAAPVWFIDNSADTFRIFRQPNSTTAGSAFMSVSNAGTVSVPGDVVLTGADCAEHFTAENAASLEPGTVVVLSDDGSLKRSDIAYDTKVVGVVSGAGEHRAAITLDSALPLDSSVPLALNGKAFCKVNAESTSITVGDLLTTSDLPGHAMKASDPSRSFGAIIGKALRPLPAGRGLIPILVSLQ
jgi:hypothetical protein